MRKIITILAFIGAYAMAADEAITAKLHIDQFKSGLNVPIFARLEIVNNTELVKIVKIDLDNLLSVVNADPKGPVVIKPERVEGGIKALMAINLAAKSSSEIPFVMDTYVSFTMTGKYMLELKPKLDGIVVKAVDVTIEKNNDQADNVKQKWEKFNENKGRNLLGNAYADYFTLGRSQEFSPYQKKLLEDGSGLTLSQKKELIASLLNYQSEEEMSTVRSVIEKNPKSVYSLIALYDLSKMSKDWWSKSRSKIFSGLESQLKYAAPISEGG